MGSEKKNMLYGLDGADILTANDGNDILDGGTGIDRMSGGRGNDTYYVDDAGDRVIETSSSGGTDRVFTSASYTLGAYVEALTATGSSAISLTGNSLANAITGNAGKNTLKGNGGNDKISGGSGADNLYGGSGADTFVFTALKDSTVSSSGRDTIHDFSSRYHDKLDLKAIDASTKKSGNQAFTFIEKSAFHHKAGELRYTKTGSGVYVYGDVNGDGKGDFSFFLKGVPTLSKGDFIL
jgi:Ca2+-binding RTX toxin-like protein